MRLPSQHEYGAVLHTLDRGAGREVPRPARPHTHTHTHAFLSGLYPNPAEAQNFDSLPSSGLHDLFQLSDNQAGPTPAPFTGSEEAKALQGAFLSGLRLENHSQADPRHTSDRWADDCLI